MLTVLVTVGAVIYTAGMLLVARRGQRRGGSVDFLQAGRQFSSRQVFVMISALWCSSIFVVEMETGYLYGLSAIWFGLGTILMALASGYLLPTLRRLGYLTSSGLIGERFGPVARVVSGVVVGVTFPIFAMSNIVGAAAFLHLVVGWSLPVTLLVTGAVVTAYGAIGGMRGLASTQSINFAVMVVGLVLAVIVAFHAVPASTIAAHVPARLLRPGGAGADLIVTWVAAALLNVVNAQAEFQVLTAARDERSGRRGLNAALVMVAVFTVGSVAVGVAARAGSAPHTLGLVAFPALMMRSAPPLLVAVVALAVWASALSWSAPLMLSGASSLGVDVLAFLRRSGPAALEVSRRRCVRVCLPLQAALLVGYGLLRPADLAWWRIFGQTLRTGALIGPTTAVLFLPTVRKNTAVASMVAGAVGGIGWNFLTGFSVDRFALGINPMWVGAAAGVAVTGADLMQRAARAADLSAWFADRAIITSVLAGVVLVLAIAFAHRALAGAGLVGPAVLGAAADAVVVGWLAQRPPDVADADVAIELLGPT